MKTRQQAVDYGLTFKDTYMETPFRDTNWQLIRVKGSKKAFLWIYERNGFVNLNVKVDPQWRDFWRETYKSVIAGYHQNKEHWNTIILDGTISDKEIKRMIAESYDIITDSPTKRIYEAVKKIPKGHVATYGRIAEMAGEPKMARAVAMRYTRILIRSIFHVFAWLILRVNFQEPLLLVVKMSRQEDLWRTELKWLTVKLT